MIQNVLKTKNNFIFRLFFLEIKNADCKSDIKPDNKFFNISDLLDFSLQLVKNDL